MSKVSFAVSRAVIGGRLEKPFVLKVLGVQTRLIPVNLGCAILITCVIKRGLTPETPEGTRKWSVLLAPGSVSSKPRAGLSP